MKSDRLTGEFLLYKTVLPIAASGGGRKITKNAKQNKTTKTPSVSLGKLLLGVYFKGRYLEVMLF